jgi:hypothetical protein
MDAMSIGSVPGFDALQASVASRSYAGEDVLSASVTQTPAPAPTANASTAAVPAKNPYRSAYDQIMTASSVALMRALGNGPTASAPQFADGSPASSLSGISTMMDALKAGMAQGMFTGTGFDREG